MTLSASRRTNRRVIIGFLLIDLLIVAMLFLVPFTTVITYRVNNINGAPAAAIEYRNPDSAATQPRSINSELPWKTDFMLKRTLFQRWFGSLPPLQISAQASQTSTVPTILIECEIIVDDDVLVRNRDTNAVFCQR